MSGENNNTAATVTDHSDVTGDTGALTDEDDVHKCGRCLEEFSALQLFLQHKLSRSCKRPGAAPDQQPREAETENEAWSGHTDDSADEDAAPPSAKPPVNLNAEGRCVCGVCQKSFKTANILRTHMFIHSDQKDFKCEICDTAFRTKGSLIRHNRRHTDERPYRCGQCGLAFRESGALTRHLKSLTPCTEKLRYSQCREILVSKDGAQKVQRASAEAEKEELPVVNVVETAAEIIQIQVLDQAGRVQQVVSQPQASVVEAENLICQAIINSGITLQTDSAHQEPPPKSLLQAPEVEVTEECVETLAEEAPDSEGKEGDATRARLYKCPHCERVFKTLAYLRVHIKGHVGYKPFKCLSCQKEFLTGYVLKKHMDTHLTERRFKCGECGKLFKAIGHVREHMRAHSDERPYRCSFCDKSYKTKNALQVHHRTHADDKPYECPSCSRGFREKSALIRHIRHHTGEKPFKCARCGRGFAEHGTLNRHMRAKGGCVLPGDPEKQVATPVDPDDPHALLVEFSSVVADTQEYIIGTPVEGGAHSEEVTIIQDNQQQMDSHIMKVVQQIVSQSHGGHQIIVRNVSADEAPGLSDCGDTITIATPESLTEQVAMTLASAIGDGAILAAGAEPASHQQLAVMESHGAEEAEQQFVIASPEEMEIQTVVVV